MARIVHVSTPTSPGSAASRRRSRTSRGTRPRQVTGAGDHLHARRARCARHRARSGRDRRAPRRSQVPRGSRSTRGHVAAICAERPDVVHLHMGILAPTAQATFRIVRRLSCPPWSPCTACGAGASCWLDRLIRLVGSRSRSRPSPTWPPRPAPRRGRGVPITCCAASTSASGSASAPARAPGCTRCTPRVCQRVLPLLGPAPHARVARARPGAHVAIAGEGEGSARRAPSSPRTA